MLQVTRGDSGKMSHSAFSQLHRLALDGYIDRCDAYRGDGRPADGGESCSGKPSVHAGAYRLWGPRLHMLYWCWDSHCLPIIRVRSYWDVVQHQRKFQDVAKTNHMLRAEIRLVSTVSVVAFQTVFASAASWLVCRHVHGLLLHHAIVPRNSQASVSC